MSATGSGAAGTGGSAADTLGPALSRAVRNSGPVDLKMLTAQALQMGDECHNRNVAATSLLARLLAPALIRSSFLPTPALSQRPSTST